MIVSLNTFGKEVCIGDMDETSEEALNLISSSFNITSAMNGEKSLPKLDDFLVVEFCEELTDANNFKVENLIPLVLNYLNKFAGKSNKIEKKNINDEPFLTYYKKYIPLIKCDVENSLGMTKENTLIKLIIEKAQLELLQKTYFNACSKSLPKDKRVDVNMPDTVNGEEESVLDFLDKLINYHSAHPDGSKPLVSRYKDFKEKLVIKCLD